MTLGGRGGTYTNVGIPGTGLYSRTRVGGGKSKTAYQTDEEDFESKVKTIKESYFPNQVKQDEKIEQKDVVSEDSPQETPKMNNIMEAYSQAIARK